MNYEQAASAARSWIEGEVQRRGPDRGVEEPDPTA
jgi:hypothetical protein